MPNATQHRGFCALVTETPAPLGACESRSEGILTLPKQPHAMASRLARHLALSKRRMHRAGRRVLEDGGCDDQCTQRALRQQSATEACVAACEACSRCRYISVSAEANVCAWYSDCDVGDLRSWWGPRRVGAEWTTVQVRESIPPPAARRWSAPPPAEASRASNGSALRLAIATLSYPPPRSLPAPQEHCAFRLWCQGARRLQQALSGPWVVSVLILWLPVRGWGGLSLPPPRPAAFCSFAQVIEPDQRLLQAARSCLAQQRRRRYQTGMPPEVLLKWQFVGMTEYDAVLFVDQDVDLMPVEICEVELRTRWRAMLPFVLRFGSPATRRGALPPQVYHIDGARAPRAGLKFIGASDGSSPVNTGLMLLLPSLRLYREGLRVLASCPLNVSHGWGLVGPPRALLEAPRYLKQRYVSPAAGGATTLRPRVDEAYFWFTHINTTGAMTNNWWRYVAAAEDQGFFWYMMFLRHDFGAYFNPDASQLPGNGPRRKQPAHWAFHYFGTVAGAKAWNGRLWDSEEHRKGQASPRLGYNLHYLSRVRPHLPSESAACDGEMAGLRRSAEAHPLARGVLPDRRGHTRREPPRFAIW